MSKTFQWWDWNQIFLFTLAHIHHLYWTWLWEHGWWLKELAMLSGQFYPGVSLHLKGRCIRNGAAGGSEYGSLSLVTFSFLWKQDSLLVGEGLDLHSHVYPHWDHSQTSHRIWITAASRCSIIHCHTILNFTSTTCWCTCPCTAVKASGLFWMETGY